MSLPNSMGISLGLIHMLNDKNRNNDHVVQFLNDVLSMLDKRTDIDLRNANEITILLDTIKEIGKGKDGIFGTEDDILPKSLVNEIACLENTTVLEDIISMFKHKRKHGNVLKVLMCYKCLS